MAKQTVELVAAKESFGATTSSTKTCQTNTQIVLEANLTSETEASKESLVESEGQEDEPPTMAKAVTQIQEKALSRETDVCIGTKESKLGTTEEAKGPFPTVQAVEAHSVISQTTPRLEGLSLPEEKDTMMVEAPKMTISNPSLGLPAFLTRFNSLEFNSLPASHFHHFGPPFVNFLQFYVPAEGLPLLEGLLRVHEDFTNGFRGGMHTLLPSLLYLKLWFCPELESFSEGGLPSNLQILEIVSCEKLFLRRMEWGLQSLHSLREIRIWYDGREVGSFPEEALLPPSLISLDISFQHLTSLNGRGFQHLTLLKQLEIFDCDNLPRLPEEGFPASLSILDIYKD
uniref:Uncharacterized protein n=1 Tax=Quercus lobata TaxID=97700 RepID=A0A7N2LPD1_QUELO